MRLRCGELPVFLVTVRPIPASGALIAMACSENAVRPARWPVAALRNCARLRRRLSPLVCGAAVMRPDPLGRELLAAERAAQIEDLATVLGRHAGAEAVAAGAHED